MANLVASRINFISNFSRLCTQKNDSYVFGLWRQQFEEKQNFKIGKNSFYVSQAQFLSIDGTKGEWACRDGEALKTKEQIFYFQK